MRNLRPQLLALAAAFSAAGAAQPADAPGQLLDRVVAVVERAAILDSEVREQARLVAFVEGEELNLRPTRLAQALDRLIYQRLAEQEMRIADFDEGSQTAVDQQLARLKQLTFAGGLSYEPALRRYGVTEAAVRRFLTRFITLERFLSFRFRTGLNPTDEEIEARYNRDYPPGTPRRAPLGDVEERIRQQLAEATADAAIDEWIRELYGRTYIEQLYDYQAAPEPAPQVAQP